MEFKNFENEFLLQLKFKDGNCLKLIEINKELIDKNLGNDADPKRLDKFVNGINNIILKTESSILKNNFKLIEKVLKHPYFDKVLYTFNNSDILVKACKAENKSAAKWLITNMNVSPYIQDEDGVSALMYAAKYGFKFVVKPFFNDSRCMNLEDKHGNNILFYAVLNKEFAPSDGTSKFAADLINSEVDINHINHNCETVLSYCIKNNIFKPINQYLLHCPKIDVNIADEDGYTPAMYLASKGRYSEFVNLHRKGCNYDYIDRYGESALSILIKKFYSPKEYRNGVPYESYVRVMSALVNHQSDFNIPIDKDENTAFMISLIVNDSYTTNFCAKYLKKLDLSVKNKYGESVTSLIFKTKHYELMKYIRENPTFDYHYRDRNNQNTLLILSAINNPTVMIELLENDPSIINEVNCKNENALIIASKINYMEVVKTLLEKGINVNQQDYMGNTALHYAVDIQKPTLIHRLVKKNASIHIKNNEGLSPLEKAKELKNEDIINALTNPSYEEDKIQSKSEISNKYYEEVRKYLTPYINNEYPDFVSTSSMNKAKNDIYGRNEGIESMEFTSSDAALLLLLLI